MIFWIFASHTNDVSLINCNKLTIVLFLPTFNPVYSCLLTVCLTIFADLLSIRNKNGVIRSHCLNPFEGLNSLVGLPLTKIEIMVDLIHHLSHPIHLLQNPSLFIMYYKTFLKSNHKPIMNYIVRNKVANILDNLIDISPLLHTTVSIMFLHVLYLNLLTRFSNP